MEARQVVTLAIAFVAGFGGGMIVAGQYQRGKTREQVALAVEEAKREFEARRGLDGGGTAQLPEPVAPAGTAASASPPPSTSLPGVQGASGKQMVQELVYQKYGGEPVPPEEPEPAPPAATAAASAAEKPAETDPPFPKVLDVAGNDEGSTVRVIGTVKNMGSGPCVSAFVTVIARDARGVTLGQRQTTTVPPSIDPFSTARFEAQFPPEMKAKSFTAQVVCR